MQPAKATHLKRRGSDDDENDRDAANFDEKKRKKVEEPVSTKAKVLLLIHFRCLRFHSRPSSQKPVKRKSKKLDVDDSDHSSFNQTMKKPRKAMTPEEWLVDSTVNLQPNDDLEQALIMEKLRNQEKERLLLEKEREITTLKVKVAEKWKAKVASSKYPRSRESPPSATSDDTNSDQKLGLPMRKLRPLLSLANSMDSDDSASEATSHLLKPRTRSVCASFQALLSLA